MMLNWTDGQSMGNLEMLYCDSYGWQSKAGCGGEPLQLSVRVKIEAVGIIDRMIISSCNEYA
jgi:hypothetical protein